MFPHVHQDSLAWGAVEEGDKGRERQHSERPLNPSTGNTGIPPRSEGALPRCPSSQLAPIHAKRTTRAQSRFCGLRGIELILSQKKGTSHPAQSVMVTRKKYTPSDLQSCKVTASVTCKHKRNPSAWPPAPKLRTNMACFLSEYQSSPEQCHPAD